MRAAQRVLLMALMGVVGINVWTGNPLLALWVGSRVVDSGQLTIGAVGVVAGMMGAVGYALLRVLAVLGAAYDKLTGHTATVRRHVPWLRSQSGERVEYQREREGLSGLEVVLVVSVVLAVVAFEIWFFFFSTSPIDQRSGRS